MDIKDSNVRRPADKTFALDIVTTDNRRYNFLYFIDKDKVWNKDIGICDEQLSNMVINKIKNSLAYKLYLKRLNNG
jgi:hypothetical protein